MKGIRKAIIPAAGFGTRHLPITKAVPKEMLPVLSKPAIDYVVSECIAAGINEICIVISRSKAAIPDYLDHKPELEAALTKAGKRDLLDVVNPFSGKADFYFIRQPEMKGTGNAVRICKEFIAGEDFAVLFPDDIIDSAVPVIGQLITAYETTGTSIVGVQKMPPEQAKMLNPLSLAFVGDAVYTLFAREKVIQHSDAKNNVLHGRATVLVKAAGQADKADEILPLLTSDEADIFRRAKNCKAHTVAKHATLADYKKATAFEALVGYLYLTGQKDRLQFLLSERDNICQE